MPATIYHWKPGMAIAAALALLLHLGACSRDSTPDANASLKRQEDAAKALGVPKELAVDLDGNASMKLVLIPAGKFLMGASPNEEGYYLDEGPQHEVSISRGFYMGIYPVTQEQYEQVMGRNPSSIKMAQTPVGTHSWYEAVEFCARMSKKAGKVTRLPTEAEWEYACRAGSATRFHYGDDPGYRKLGEYAWYEDAEGTVHPVGQKKPNAWGLYEMHGDIAQWCSDWSGPYQDQGQTDPHGPASGSHRIARGGGWEEEPMGYRSASRYGDEPNSQRFNLSFRVVLEPK